MMRIEAGQIVAASPRLCPCLQCPEHPAVSVRKKYPKEPTNLPELAQCDFFFSLSSRGTRLKCVEATKKALTKDLTVISEESLQQCIESEQRKCNRF